MEAHEPVTPVGNPEIVASVAPVVVYVVVVTGVFIHKVCVPPEESVIVLSEFTVIVPLAEAVPQPPVKDTVYVNVPETLGVPLIVTTSEAQFPVTPVGKPVTVAPVAPVVVYVVVVIGVLIHMDCVPPDARVTVFADIIVAVFVAVRVHPPKVTVYVTIDVPAAIPETNPEAGSTVATAGAELDQVPPGVVLDHVADPPTQRGVVPLIVSGFGPQTIPSIKVTVISL